MLNYVFVLPFFDDKPKNVMEATFGSKRIQSKRDRGVDGNILVSSLLKRSDKGYVQLDKNCSKSELLYII